MEVVSTIPTVIDKVILCIVIIAIVSSLICFSFIYSKLKINHVIKKLLLFGTAQQAVGYGILSCSIITSIVLGARNKFKCFLGFTSIVASGLGTQTTVSLISVIRYIQSHSTIIKKPLELIHCGI